MPVSNAQVKSTSLQKHLLDVIDIQLGLPVLDFDFCSLERNMLINKYNLLTEVQSWF